MTTKNEPQSRVGISTYALFWESSDHCPRPITLAGMIDRAADMGCNVLQICDFEPIEHQSGRQLAELRSHADDRGVRLELGTRGIDPSHLARNLDLCEALGVRLLRSMVPAAFSGGRRGDALEELAKIADRLDAQGVELALETYEQFATSDLVSLVAEMDDPHIGIALDPANTVANLELPNDVITMCAPFTLNLHVKDFDFTREEGWVGFHYSGAPMGQGLLDYAHEMSQVRPVARGISQIVEHWLPWQGDIETTIDVERRWTEQTITHIKENQHV
ncbi:Xylose isomerase domain protein TIM barrel [Propionibacterium freudenreichii]|uniref:sugar phosphate isomerase/epimerase family protein n=1 Tax=Propionibacterium freudenreichii TaxID=1744 RepID=UPI0005432CFF|nr:TIM barrel protein [Propionibacterium freudenreichii]CEG99066.1 hexulose-6-phosphate isomerase [Propionibacterium freudenreichii]CEI28904.1 Xylose isomerase domain protein TIM barrel [Propionibacterium freudenreichii]